MTGWPDDFGPIDGTWLSACRHGALPRIAVEALNEAIAWKRSPPNLPDEAVGALPRRVKTALGRIVNAPAEDIVLGTSASFGINAIAAGARWREGDEVLCVDGDFPATVYPWLALEQRGVTVRMIRPAGAVPDADEVARHITPATRVFCASWVCAFTGHAIDLEAIGALCRDRGVRFVVDGSQAVGARPIDVAAAPIDAISSCGHKWLCGPYGTGFAWISPEWRAEIDPGHVYWEAMHRVRNPGTLRDYAMRDDPGADAFDAAGLGFFFQYAPWAAAVEYIAGRGVAAIDACNDGLVARLIAGLDRDAYTLLSPATPPARSAIAVVSHRDAARNADIAARLAGDGVYLSLREGVLRVAPHLYNTTEDIDRTLELLAAAA